jgi:hypothetical protein
MCSHANIVIPAGAKQRAGTQGNSFAGDFWVPGLARGLARDDRRRGLARDDTRGRLARDDKWDDC